MTETNGWCTFRPDLSVQTNKYDVTVTCGVTSVSAPGVMPLQVYVLNSPTMTLVKPNYTVVPAICEPTLSYQVFPVSGAPANLQSSGLVDSSDILELMTYDFSWQVLSPPSPTPLATTFFQLEIQCPVISITLNSMSQIDYDLGTGGVVSTALPGYTIDPPNCQSVALVWSVDPLTPAFVTVTGTSIDVSTSLITDKGLHKVTLYATYTNGFSASVTVDVKVDCIVTSLTLAGPVNNIIYNLGDSAHIEPVPLFTVEPAICGAQYAATLYPQYQGFDESLQQLTVYTTDPALVDTFNPSWVVSILPEFTTITGDQMTQSFPFTVTIVDC